MHSLYSGIWVPGETGFTGWKGDRFVIESKTWFTMPEWFPIIGWRSYGLQHRVKLGQHYDRVQIIKMLRRFDIQVFCYDDNLEILHKKTVNDPNDVYYKHRKDSTSVVYCVDADGNIIGELTEIYNLWKRYGIEGFHRPSGEGPFNVGYAPSTNKWYGWSHRAIKGFTIGSEVKKGDIAYQAQSLEEYMEYLKNFYDADRCYYDPSTMQIKIEGSTMTITEGAPMTFGRGEWKAESMDDAYQMAIDFAEAVS